MTNPTPNQRLPKYRHQKSRDLAVVRIDGRDYYLGRYNSPESHAEYRRLLAEWLAKGKAPSLPKGGSGDDGTPTITELMVPYIHHVDAYYVKNGLPTSEAGLVRLSLRVLKQLYGHTPAKDFGPRALEAVRKTYIDLGLCRNEVNRRTRHVVRFFKWAVKEELVPPSVHHGLKAVEGLRKGRSGVRESKPVKPVPDAFVDAVRPFVSRQVWAMIELQRFSGMRPGEACIMRSCDLDTTGNVWTYTPGRHKTEHHGRERKVYLGPHAQDVLRPWLRADLTAYLFSPRDSMAELTTKRRNNRKTPLTPSQRTRTRKRKPKKTPGEQYTPNTYRNAIVNACKRADVPAWHPNQLRHNAANHLRKEFGVDTARAVLGHSDVATTTIYAERDSALAAAAMEQFG